MAPKFVGKKILFAVPLIGWTFLVMGMVPINRGDRTKAIKALNIAVDTIMKRYHRSVALFMEGKRTRDGHLVLPFKKGPLHIQRQTQAPILPMILQGTYALWPPGQTLCRTGRVMYRQLPAIPFDSNRSVEDTRGLLQRAYLDALYRDSRHRFFERTPLTLGDRAEHAVVLVLFFAFVISYASMFIWIVSALQLSAVTCSLVTLAIGVAMSAYVIYFV